EPHAPARGGILEQRRRTAWQRLRFLVQPGKQAAPFLVHGGSGHGSLPLLPVTTRHGRRSDKSGAVWALLFPFGATGVRSPGRRPSGQQKFTSSAGTICEIGRFDVLNECGRKCPPGPPRGQPVAEGEGNLKHGFPSPSGSADRGRKCP